VEALANGARAIYPTSSTEEAVKLASSFGRADTLLCGERRGLRVEGFHLGNSPAEFARERVKGKRIVMSTTNGTTAFAAAQGAARIVACALTNLGAVAEAVRDGPGVVVICAGRQGHFAIDDVLCAGHLLLRLGVTDDSAWDLDDGGRAALILAGALTPDQELLGRTTGGRALKEIGLAADLEICAHFDRHSVVPTMVERALVLTRG
jgi:2-phosphosulfolactate phosphatase